MRLRRTILASSAGAVALAGALAAALLWPGEGLSDDGPHKLVTPETVLKTYRGHADPRGRSLVHDNHAALGVTHAKGARAVYWAHDRRGMPDGTLIVSGTYGTVSSPKKALDVFFGEVLRRQDAENGLSKLLGKPQEEHPDGFTNAVMRCQVARSISLTGERMGDSPFCVWADHSTVVRVDVMDDREELTAAELAQLAADLRNEIRVPVRD
jgi:hypothetical protein